MKKSKIFLCACAAAFIAGPALSQDYTATANETRLAAQEADLRAMNGRIEQVEFAMRRLEQALQRLQSDVDARLGKLEQAGTLPSVPSAAAPPAPVDPRGTLGALKMQGGKVTGAVNNPQAPPLPAVPGDYGLTPPEQYERAFNFLREANYPEAETAFKGFIEKNPQDKLLDNAKYWYGETLYVRARFEEAAIAFADAYKQNPKGVKAPDSLLKLGMTLAALNQKPDACVTYAELKNKFPNASATIKARADEERQKLKCPAR